MIVVAGENVVDLIPQPDGDLRPALGGGPANIAVAVARLGAPVAMVARLGGDVFGARFRERLLADGVDGRYLVDSADPSTLALASIGPGGGASFDFWLTGAADFGWHDADLPELAAGDLLHLGSLAAFLTPGAPALERWAARHRARGMVAFDPNLRPIVLSDRQATLDRLERLVRLAHVVKVSEDDLALAYPGTEPIDAARRWVEELDTSLVLVTLGGAGITALAPGRTVHRPAPRVDVVDTIGAGDAAMAALLVRLYRAPDAVPPANLAEMLDYVCAVGALACTRPGADAPTARGVEEFLTATRPA